MSEAVTNKISYYYQNLRIKFIDFHKKHELLFQFNSRLADELILAFNHELIKNVKFF